MLRKLVLWLMFIPFLFSPLSTRVGGVHQEISGLNCDVQEFEVGQLDSAAGQLLYYAFDGKQWGQFSTVYDRIRANSISQNSVVSPNGLWLARTGYDDGSSALIVQEINGDRRYMMFVQPDFWFSKLYWLNDTDILIVWIPTGVRHMKWYPYEILMPFTTERINVEPNEIGYHPPGSEPLFPFTTYGEDFWISPNGQFALFEGLPYARNLDGDGIYIFDIRTKTFVDHAGSPYRPWVWSPASNAIAFYGYDLLTEEQNAKEIRIFYIEQNTTTQVTDLNLQQEWVKLYGPLSWSPDGEFLAFGLGTFDIDAPEHLHILHIPTGDIIETCLLDSKWPNNVAWSRDSRYLAFYGNLATDQPNEEAGLFLYDLLEDQIFQVKGVTQIEIIGWAALED